MVLFPARHQKKILNCNANKLQKQEYRYKTNGVFSSQTLYWVKFEIGLGSQR